LYPLHFFLLKYKFAHSRLRNYITAVLHVNIILLYRITDPDSYVRIFLNDGDSITRHKRKQTEKEQKHISQDLECELEIDGSLIENNTDDVQFKLSTARLGYVENDDTDSVPRKKKKRSSIELPIDENQFSTILNVTNNSNISDREISEQRDTEQEILKKREKETRKEKRKEIKRIKDNALNDDGQCRKIQNPDRGVFDQDHPEQDARNKKEKMFTKKEKKADNAQCQDENDMKISHLTEIVDSNGSLCNRDMLDLEASTSRSSVNLKNSNIPEADSCVEKECVISDSLNSPKFHEQTQMNEMIGSRLIFVEQVLGSTSTNKNIGDEVRDRSCLESKSSCEYSYDDELGSEEHLKTMSGHLKNKRMRNRRKRLKKREFRREGRNIKNMYTNIPDSPWTVFRHKVDKNPRPCKSNLMSLSTVGDGNAVSDFASPHDGISTLVTSQTMLNIPGDIEIMNDQSQQITPSLIMTQCRSDSATTLDISATNFQQPWKSTTESANIDSNENSIRTNKDRCLTSDTNKCSTAFLKSMNIIEPDAIRSARFNSADKYLVTDSLFARATLLSDGRKETKEPLSLPEGVDCYFVPQGQNMNRYKKNKKPNPFENVQVFCRQRTTLETSIS